MGLHQQKQFITVFEFAWVSLVNSFLNVMVKPSFFPYYILDDTLDNHTPMVIIVLMITTMMKIIIRIIMRIMMMIMIAIMIVIMVIR